MTWSDDKSRLVYQIDDAVQITIGNGCTYTIDNDHTSIRCEVVPSDAKDPYATLSMNLRDGNDVVEFHNNTKQVFYFNEFYLAPARTPWTVAALRRTTAVSSGGRTVRTA